VINSGTHEIKVIDLGLSGRTNCAQSDAEEGIYEILIDRIHIPRSQFQGTSLYFITQHMVKRGIKVPQKVSKYWRRCCKRILGIALIPSNCITILSFTLEVGLALVVRWLQYEACFGLVKVNPNTVGFHN
jgi:hypothetical protein